MNNRTIKFRAWNPSTKQFISFPKWDDAVEPNGNSYGTIMELSDLKGYCIWSQSTGLFDKNGKEIYEGDIVVFVGGTCDFIPYGIYCDRHIKGTKFVVVKLLSGYTLMMPNHIDQDIPSLNQNVDNYTFWNSQRSLEVIGNIYTNPELLKANPASL